ncbi:MAG: MurT ligase domain-containing protein [Candidatus Daviesbacteria bacterium]|nr:MurT ligase domain-containing protein [Candidatus Daviesbacteria bacterium]
MRLTLAILLGKLISFLTKYLKIGGGSAAPGLYALKVCPDLVEKLAGRIPKNVVITGTNGKTTTAKMLAHFAKESGLKVIRNHTGSNLERGIASTLIQSLSLHLGCGKLNFDLGIWELDEAAFNTVAPKLKPDVVVFLNVFRDQLDRYGEIDTVVKKWQETIKKFPPETQILVNGDDTNTSKLAAGLKGKVKKFGIKDYKIVGESIENLKEKEKLNFEAKNVKLHGLIGSSFDFTIHHTPYTIHLPLPGLYHIYDALAAFACTHLLGLPTHRLTDALNHYTPAFGRVEKLDFGYIFLIKNPAGATQVFETIAPNIKPGDRLLLALNDNLADGTDVSWIWDAMFEKLRTTNYELRTICSGSRAYDLATRLKYAGFEAKQIMVESDLKKAFKEARKGLKGQLFILPTYTAMLELQSILARSGLKKPYWEDV